MAVEIEISAIDRGIERANRLKVTVGADMTRAMLEIGEGTICHCITDITTDSPEDLMRRLNAYANVITAAADAIRLRMRP
jgi:hypothetical protein